MECYHLKNATIPVKCERPACLGCLNVEGGRPITSEWLEGVGARLQSNAPLVFWFELDDCELVVRFWNDVAFVRIGLDTYLELPHIKNRHDFSELYQLLAGRELGDG